MITRFSKPNCPRYITQHSGVGVEYRGITDAVLFLCITCTPSILLVCAVSCAGGFIFWNVDVSLWMETCIVAQDSGHNYGGNAHHAVSKCLNLVCLAWRQSDLDRAYLINTFSDLLRKWTSVTLFINNIFILKYIAIYVWETRNAPS